MREAATASAVRSVPSWNFTPSRMVKSHSNGEACFHSVARNGTTFPWAESYLVSVSKQPDKDRMYAASDSGAQLATGARKLSTTMRWLVSATFPADSGLATAEATTGKSEEGCQPEGYRVTAGSAQKEPPARYARTGGHGESEDY